MNEDLLSDAAVPASDIARLAGVGRAAVGNWRRRFADFPDPVGGTAAAPLYRLGDVEHWLADHDRAISVAPVDRIWQWLRSETDDRQLATVLGHIGAFLVLLNREPGTAPTADAVDSATPELPGRFPEHPGPELLTVVETLATVVAQRGPAATLAFLMERYADAQRRPAATGAATAEAVVRITDVAGRSVFDPACGTGALLAAAITAGATAAAAQDIEVTAARLTGARLLLQGAVCEVRAGDSLADDAFAGRRFGVVLCHVPPGDRGWNHEELAGDTRWVYGLPPRTEPELAWVQHCLAHLEPGGAGAVLMPSAAASRRAGRRIRGNLIRSGAVRAVITMPAEPCDLWVLRASGEPPPSHLLLALPPDIETATALWAAYRTDPERGDTAISRAVKIVDLLDDEVDLAPSRHIRVRQDPEEADFGQARAQLAADFADLAGLIPDLPSGLRNPAMTTVGELARAGVVALSQAPLRMIVRGAADGDGDVPVLTAQDVAAGRSATGRTHDQAGLVMVEAGDVVVPAMPKDAEVRVVTDENAALGPRLLCLRVDPERLDPHFLAGFLRVASASTVSSSSGSGGFSRTDARRVPIPLMTIVEQRRCGMAFRELGEFLATMRASAAAGEALARRGFEGLASGRLLPGR